MTVVSRVVKSAVHPARTGALTVVLFAVVIQAADAHGPCNCVFPELGGRGAKVRISSPVYKVILNPRKSDFLIGPGGLESAYRADAPRAILFSRPKMRPGRRASVVIPRAFSPGLYMLLIYDGSEGGVHYTWDYFQVLGAAGGPARDGDSDTPEFLLPAAGAVIGLIGVAAALLYRRRLRQ